MSSKNLMGCASRRKQKYSAVGFQKVPAKSSMPPLMPDYGTHYLKSFGVTPLTAWIEHPNVVIGSLEANITWNAFGYMATLIVTPEVGRAYLQNPSMLNMIPDPNDAYVTPLGERVVPFKLVPEVGAK